MAMQGFWPDGLHTAPTDEALQYDMDMILSVNLTTLRKHIKVEPDRWYYHADRCAAALTIGCAWEVMPCAGLHIWSAEWQTSCTCCISCCVQLGIACSVSNCSTA